MRLKDATLQGSKAKPCNFLHKVKIPYSGGIYLHGQATCILVT